MIFVVYLFIAIHFVLFPVVMYADLDYIKSDPPECNFNLSLALLFMGMVMCLHAVGIIQ